MAKIFLADFRRIIFSKMFFCSVILVALFEILDALPLALASIRAYGSLKNSVDVIYLLYTSGSTLYHLFTVTLAILPIAGLFVEHYENHVLHHIVVRTSYPKYTSSTMLMGFTGSFFCMVCGELLFVGMLLLLFPMIRDEALYSMSFQSLREGHYWLYICYVILLRGLRAGFFGMISLTVSVFVTNKLFIYSLPTIMYFILLFITVDMPNMLNIEFLRRFNISNVFFTFQFGVDKEVLSLFFTFCYTLVTGVVLWRLYHFGVRRKVS